MTTGWFISPSGKASGFSGDRERHIDAVLRSPAKFGLDAEELRATFSEYDEPYGSGSKGREKVLLNLLRQGWVRIREYPNEGTFSVQVWRWTRRMKDAVSKFFEKREDEYGPYTNVQLHSLGDGQYKLAHLGSIAGSLMSERRR